MSVPHLALILQHRLKVAWIDSPVTFPVEVEGQVFYPDERREDVVFYDWIADSVGSVHALEIHLEPGDPHFRSKVPISDVASVEIDVFVRLWLSEVRRGVPLGLEAFGDLHFAHSMDGRLAIIVAIDTWLSPWRAQDLLSRLR